jgi:hypothetical protein
VKLTDRMGMMTARISLLNNLQQTIKMLDKILEHVHCCASENFKQSGTIMEFFELTLVKIYIIFNFKFMLPTNVVSVRVISQRTSEDNFYE